MPIAVDARVLLRLFDTVYLLSLTAWVGGLLFFAFGVVPLLVRSSDRDSAARFARALFPRFYAWGATAGAIALPASLGGPLCFPEELRGPAVGVRALAILAGTMLMLYCGNSLAPALRAAAEANDEARLHRLHRRGVRLNGVVLLLGLGLLVAFVNRPVPKSAGIREPTPQERFRLSAQAFEKRQADYEAARNRLSPGGASRPGDRPVK